jgi:hypothetical protein
MHLIDEKAYSEDDDKNVRQAHPRLCEAVATVLYRTSPQFLAAFLDLNVKKFEWRRNGNCVMIQRDGDQVNVGSYHNYVTKYVWTYFTHSFISEDGAWTSSYGAVDQLMTSISSIDVGFHLFEEEPSPIGIDPMDDKWARYMGRFLGSFLWDWTVWDYQQWHKWTVE